MESHRTAVTIRLPETPKGRIGQGHLLTHMAALWKGEQGRGEEGLGPSTPTGNSASPGSPGPAPGTEEPRLHYKGSCYRL